jgi:ClpP class serine protease
MVVPVLFLTFITCSYYGYYIYKAFLLINTIESKHKSKIIYVKDVNTKFSDKVLGLIFKNKIISINDNNSLRIYLQANPNSKIIILLRSVGGYVSSSDSMLGLLDSHKPNKTVYVPSYAMSAAALLCLACDTIYMSKYAAFGPTDPQISVFDDMVSFRTISRLIESKPIDKIKDKILITYYENKVLYDDNINIVKKYINKHKKKNTTQDAIEQLVNKFSYGNIPHHAELSYNELEKVININNTIPEDILSLYKLLNFIFNIW